MRLLGLLAALMFSATVLTGQGIDFFHGTWDEAIEKAGKENKLVFVDAYTTWCGPCRRMAKNVFPLEEVGEYYNANFINVKMDMEKPEGRRFNDKYRVTAYPTFFWIDPDGKVVFTTKGGRQPAEFIALGELAASKYDGSAKYRALYEDGKRDYETIYGYAQQLAKNGESPVRIVNEYLDTQDDLSTPENLDMILVGAWQVDSKIFEYLEEHEKQIVHKHGQEAFDSAVRNAAVHTVDRAKQYQSRDLLDEANTAMSRHLKEEADEFAASSEMDYAVAMRDAAMFCESAKTYMKKYADGKAARLNSIALQVIEHFEADEECLKLGLKASKEAVKINDKESYLLTHAALQYLNGDKDGALRTIDTAIEHAEDENKRKQLEAIRRQYEEA